MSLRLLLDIIRSRLFLVLLTLAITVGSAAAITYFEPKRYQATSSIVINFDKDSPFDTTALPSQLASTYLATQLDIVRSQKVAMRVVNQRGLAKDPGWRDAYAAAGDPGIPINPWIATQIATNLDVEPLTNSRVVNLTYEAAAPDEAAKMANAYAQAFIATSLELSVEPARRSTEWFDKQLKVLRKRLDAARARMTELQVSKGIVALDDKLSAETTRLDDISRNLVEAQMATEAARARQLGENHPDFVSARQREAALTAALNTQKRSILQLKSQRDELDTLAQEVDSEQQNYTATLQSYYKTMMESQFNQTNVALLSPAFPPTDPSSPNVPLNMLSALVLGLLLGLVVAVSAEMLNPRVKWDKKHRHFVGEALTPV